MSKVVAIIPARKGSKRLPDKNKKLFAGKPLICWTVDVALESMILDEIIVSTDDEDIFNILEDKCKENYRYESIKIHKRTPELASDKATLDKVVLSCLNGYPMDTVVVLLQPTSPLRDSADINIAVNMYLTADNFPLVSCFRKNDYEFKLNGAIYITKLENLYYEMGFINKLTIFYMMDVKNSIDIDTLTEFEMAENVMEERLKSGR